MRRRSLARVRALTGCAFAALAAAIGGCTAATSSPSVSGNTLKIYLSVPPGGSGAEPAADVLAAERLAFQQASGGHTVGHFTIKLVSVAGSKISDNARSAIEDSKAIAYVGELMPGASADSVGITNAIDLLQVSPTDTALELTRSTAAVPGSPGHYYEALGTYGRTFARVVPTDALEAKATVSEMSTLGITKIYVTGDGSAYGKALALALKRAASRSVSVASSTSGAQAVFYAGGSAGAAASEFNRAISGNPALRLFAPSALSQDSFVGALSPAAQRRLSVSSPGFTAADLPAQGKQFASSFRAVYGHAPAPQAVFGYEAVTAIMHVLHEAGSAASSRGTIVHDFFMISNRASALGTYSIGPSGDTTIVGGAPFVFSRVKSGALVPFKAVQTQG